MDDELDNITKPNSQHIIDINAYLKRISVILTELNTKLLGYKEADYAKVKNLLNNTSDSVKQIQEFINKNALTVEYTDNIEKVRIITTDIRIKLTKAEIKIRNLEKEKKEAEEELDKAKKKAEAKATEAEDAKKEIERAKVEIERAKVEIERAKKKAEKAKIDKERQEAARAAAEAKIKEAENAKKAAEDAKKTAEDAKKTAEAKAKEAEDAKNAAETKAKQDAEAKANAELAQANAELAKARQEAARAAAAETKAKQDAEAKANAELAQAKLDAQQAQKEAQQAQQAAQQAQQQLKDANDKYTQLEAQLKKQQQDITTSAINIKNCNDIKAHIEEKHAKEIEKLQKELEEEKKQIKGIPEEQFEEYKRGLDIKYERKANAISKKYDALLEQTENQIYKLKSDLAIKKQDINVLKDIESSLNARIREIEQEHRRMARKYDELAKIQEEKTLISIEHQMNQVDDKNKSNRDTYDRKIAALKKQFPSLPALDSYRNVVDYMHNERLPETVKKFKTDEEKQTEKTTLISEILKLYKLILISGGGINELKSNEKNSMQTKTIMMGGKLNEMAFAELLNDPTKNKAKILEAINAEPSADDTNKQPEEEPNKDPKTELKDKITQLIQLDNNNNSVLAKIFMFNALYEAQKVVTLFMERFMYQINQIYNKEFSYYHLFLNIFFITILIIISLILYWDNVYRSAKANSRCNELRNIIDDNGNKEKPFYYRVMIINTKYIDKNLDKYVFILNYDFKNNYTRIDYNTDENNRYLKEVYSNSYDSSKATTSSEYTKKTFKYFDLNSLNYNVIDNINSEYITGKNFKYIVLDTDDNEINTEAANNLADFVRNYGAHRSIMLYPIYDIMNAVKQDKLNSIV